MWTRWFESICCSGASRTASNRSIPSSSPTKTKDFAWTKSSIRSWAPSTHRICMHCVKSGRIWTAIYSASWSMHSQLVRQFWWNKRSFYCSLSRIWLTFSSIPALCSREKAGIGSAEAIPYNRIFGGQTRQNHRLLHKISCRAPSTARMERVVLWVLNISITFNSKRFIFEIHATVIFSVNTRSFPVLQESWRACRVRRLLHKTVARHITRVAAQFPCHRLPMYAAANVVAHRDRGNARQKATGREHFATKSSPDHEPTRCRTADRRLVTEKQRHVNASIAAHHIPWAKSARTGSQQGARTSQRQSELRKRCHSILHSTAAAYCRRFLYHCSGNAERWPLGRYAGAHATLAHPKY